MRLGGRIGSRWWQDVGAIFIGFFLFIVSARVIQKYQITECDGDI